MINQETKLSEHLRIAGFQQPENLILAFFGGSSQHGAKLPNRSDLDICGVYIERPVKVLGVDTEEHYTSSTQNQYEKNNPGDEDYKVYTLKRWASLACKGNPTILGYMFSDTPEEFKDSVWSTHIKPNRVMFQASSHAAAFLGYAKGQVARLKGEKGQGKHGQRPELAAEFGYDTKAAMHMMRMMYECEEYLTTGIITYPRPEKDLLLDIRLGEWSWNKLFAEYSDAEKRIKEAEQTSFLPEQVDRLKVSVLIMKAYFAHWKQRGVFNSPELYTNQVGYNLPE